MVIIGVVPGLTALAYVVLTWDGRLARCEDCDVLRAKARPSDGAMQDWLRRAHRHRLILSVVFERGLDAAAGRGLAVGIGPAYSDAESEGGVEHVRSVLEGLTRVLGGRSISLPAAAGLREQLADLLDEPAGTSLRLLVDGCLRAPLPSRGRAMVQATAAGLVAAMLLDRGA